MSYTGSVSYSEMILLYLYANQLLQKKSVLWVLFKCSEGSSFKSTYGWYGNNCDFSWKVMPPPVRKYIVSSLFSHTSKKFRKYSEAQWVMQIHVIIGEYYKGKPNDCYIH